VALVKVTKENTIATAGVLGGVTGLLFGGFWLGAASFVATSYLAKKDDDVSTVLKGVSTASLEALNYVDYLNNKYEVSSKVGTALSGALDSTEGETSSSVKSAVGTVNGAIDSFDKEVGIRDTLGSLVLAGSDLANQLATKVQPPKIPPRQTPRSCAVFFSLLFPTFQYVAIWLVKCALCPL